MESVPTEVWQPEIAFTSDTHFSHGNIIKYSNRPFLADADRAELERRGGSWHNGVWKGHGSSDWKITPEAVAMMDDAMIDGINRTVGPDDILYHLGDFAMAPKNPKQFDRYADRCFAIRNRIKCKNVILIWGNHDEHGIHHAFKETHDLLRTFHAGHRFSLCHYALAIWDKAHRGAIHLYGHSHSGAEGFLDRVMPGRRSMDVGMDNAYKLLGEFRPFLLGEILAIMEKRTGFGVDHHVSEVTNTPEEE